MHPKSEGMVTRGKPTIYCTPKKEKANPRQKTSDFDLSAMDFTISTKEDFTIKKVSESPFTKFVSGLSPLEILRKENPGKELFISNPLNFEPSESYPSLKLYSKFKALKEIEEEKEKIGGGKFDIHFKINKSLNRKAISKGKSKKVMLNSINSFYSDLKTPIRNQFDYQEQTKISKASANRKPFEETGKCNCKKSRSIILLFQMSEVVLRMFCSWEILR